MKAAEALIAWTPAFETIPTAGQAAVGPLVPLYGGDWAAAYSHTGGQAHQATGDRTKLLLFIQFHSMVVRDGIDPLVAHQAFLKIDEYAETIAPNLPGARGAAGDW